MTKQFIKTQGKSFQSVSGAGEQIRKGCSSTAVVEWETRNIQLRFRLAAAPGPESHWTTRAGMLWEGSRVKVTNLTTFVFKILKQERETAEGLRIGSQPVVTGRIPQGSGSGRERTSWDRDAFSTGNGNSYQRTAATKRLRAPIFYW